MSVPRPSQTRRLLITGAIALTILLAGEGSLRLWAYFFRHPYQRFDRHLGIIRLVPDYREIVDEQVLSINSWGLRGAGFQKKKPARLSRIIMLGDSVTFGRAGDDCHYPGVLQQVLDTKQPGHFEVINAAAEGYNSQDALRLLEKDLVRFSPDLVTVLLGWNDLIKQDPGRPEASALEKRLAYAMYDIYLVKLWRRIIYLHLRPLLLRPSPNLAPEEETKFRTYVPIVFRENLQRIIAVTRGAGGDVILFTLPSLLRPAMSPKDVSKLYFPHFTYNLRTFQLLHERYNETIRTVGRENGVPVIDLQDPLRGRESSLFMDTAHMECEGYRILGRYLGTVLPALIAKQSGRASTNGQSGSLR